MASGGPRCDEARVTANDPAAPASARDDNARNEAPSAPFVESELLLRGRRVRVARAGADTSPPLVLLHGTAFDHRQWSAVAPQLAGHAQLIALDAPGHGASEDGGDADAIGAFAATTLDLVAALGAGRVAIVGHSFGAAAAVRIAIERPEFVSRIVLVSLLTHLPRPRWTEQVARSPVFSTSLAMRWLRARALARHVGEGHAPPSTPWSERLTGILDDDSTSRAALRALAALRADRILDAHLPRLRTPCAMVFGRHDPFVPAGVPQRLARQSNAERLHLLDCGHRPEHDAPAELADTIASFLAPVPTTRVTRAPRVGSSG
jgi:pimeloyl-ACP methyl ester carboxylesterase